MGLPTDLRAKLAVYRLVMGYEDEALEHLSWLDPGDPATPKTFAGCPEVLRDVATQLYKTNRVALALRYFDIYRTLNRRVGEVDADSLVLQGRCLLALGDTSAAEECFLAAIEADELNIDGRLELAALYEKAHENEHAFVLVNEVLSLEAQQAHDSQPGGQGDYDEHQTPFAPDGGWQPPVPRPVPTARPRHKAWDDSAARRERVRKALEPPKKRMRRLGGESKRLAFENEMTRRLREKFGFCQALKARVAQGGDKEAQAQWMEAAKELTDDFRSFREYYPWDKYVRFLGYHAPDLADPSNNSTVAAMAERPPSE